MSDVQTVMEVARGATSAVVTGNVHVSNESPMIVFRAGEDERCDDPMMIDGISTFAWGRHTYLVRAERHPAAVRTAGRYSVVATGRGRGRLGVRGVHGGDRLDTRVGSTPVTELLRDHGISPIHRPCWPLITIDGKIAAVHGVRSAAWALPHNGDKIIIIEREVHS
jgi:hypothetical protein